MAMANVNNGVNVQALLDAREALKGAPEAAKFTWRASCKWQNGTHSKTKSRASSASAQEQKHKTETSFEADHPEIFASEDLGTTPVEYVLVGLASCLTAGVAAVAQNRGIQLRSVESKLEGTMDIQGILGIDSDVRNGYDDIKVTFNIDADASKKDIEAIVAQSQKRSAVYDVITNPTNVTVEVGLSGRTRRSGGRAIEHVTTVVIGAGHAGLAASRCLTERSIDHVVLERGEVANSWRRERWDSLRLLTPNWQSRLPGYRVRRRRSRRLHDDGRGDRVHLALRRAVRARRCAPHTTVTSVDAQRRRVSRRDRPRRHPVPLRGARERRLQPAERAGAACRRCRRRSSSVTPLDYRNPGAAARRRRAGRRRVGHRRAARRRDPPLRPAGDALGRRARAAAAHAIAAATCCGGWTPPASGTSATTRSTT